MDFLQHQREQQTLTLSLWTRIYSLSEFRHPKVFFVNRALPEVPQAIANGLRDLDTIQIQAIALGLRIIQYRAHLLLSALIRRKRREAPHVQNPCSMIDDLRSFCLFEVVSVDSISGFCELLLFSISGPAP